jgi:TetR/AcrR family transcriptional repressor of nem operon
MRYGADHAEKTKGDVLIAAADQIRVYGPAGVSVAGIMKQLGLTHGGFYAHFDSKDDLIAQALGVMFDKSAAVAKSLTVPGGGGERLRAFVRAYVSRAHRDQPNLACALTTLGNDMPRVADDIRDVFTQGAQRLTEHLVGMLPPALPNRRAVAQSMLSHMVGAVTLSRAINDTQQSDAILRHARADLMTRIDAIEAEFLPPEQGKGAAL